MRTSTQPRQGMILKCSLLIMHDVILLINKLSRKPSRFCCVCFALATREWTCLEYQSIYLEYERQIQQKTMFELRKIKGLSVEHIERKVKTNSEV